MIMFDDKGQQVWSGEADIWGNVRKLRGEKEFCPFRFAGQYEDSETGLYYNRFRYYDPEAGQYIRQDPIGLAGGMRLYGYVNDASKWIDPFGLAACGTEESISVDEALSRASDFMKDGVPIRCIDGATGVQFIQEFEENGMKITKRVGFDLNPASSHVQQLGPHLNLQTQINGKIQKSGALKDPHTPVDPSTIRPGDY